jgi:hypothetical protein
MAGSRPIETVITTDVDDVIKGAEKVADSFEDIQDSLKDTAKASGKASDQISDGFKDAAKDADTAAKNIDRDLTQALKEVENKADGTGKGMGRSFKEGADKAGEGLSELKDESNSTAKEAAASFDGSAESIADAFQEVAANALSGFGALGAGIGLAAAVGIGIAIAKMNELAEANNEAKEKAADLAREIYDAGGKLDDADIAEKIKDIAFALAEEDNPWTPWADEAKTNIEQVRDATQGLSDDLAKDIFKGLAGDVGASQRAYDVLTKSIEANRNEANNHRTVLEDGRVTFNEQGKALIANADAQEKQRQKLHEATGASEDAAAQAEYYTDVMGESSQAVEKRKEAEDKLLATQKDRIDAQNELDQATKDGITSELDYLDSIDNLNAKFKENGATMDTNTAKGRENQRAVIELTDNIEAQAKAALDQGQSVSDVTGKFNAQRDALINQLIPAFGGSRDAASKYVDQVLRIPGRVSTDVLVNDQEARRKLDDLTKARTAPLQILPDGSAVERWYMSQQGKKIFVEFAPRGGGQAAALP